MFYYYLYNDDKIIGVQTSSIEMEGAISKDEYDQFIETTQQHLAQIKYYVENFDTQTIPDEYLEEVTKRIEVLSQESEVSNEEQLNILLGGIGNAAQ